MRITFQGNSLMGVRAGCPQLCQRGILIILNLSYLRNSLSREDTRTFLCPPWKLEISPRMNSAFPNSRRQGDVLLTTARPVLRGCRNNTCYFTTQVQTNASCQFFTNLFFLCLKSINALIIFPYFWHLHSTKFNLIFSCSSVLCQSNY